MNYYITLNGKSIGPMTEMQMMAYPVGTETPVSKDGGAWAPLYTYPELMQLLQNRGGSPMGQSEIASKKTMCGILAILVGTLGIQYFVIGKPVAGFITILLSIVSCGLWGIITLVQGIMMLCMSDSEFKAKYLDSTSTLPLF